MVEMLRALKKELTILLVKHDMEAVFALANRITVLVYDRVPLLARAPTSAQRRRARCLSGRGRGGGRGHG